MISLYFQLRWDIWDILLPSIPIPFGRDCLDLLGPDMYRYFWSYLPWRAF